MIYSLTPFWSALLSHLVLGEESMGALAWTGGFFIVIASLIVASGGQTSSCNVCTKYVYICRYVYIYIYIYIYNTSCGIDQDKTNGPWVAWSVAHGLIHMDMSARHDTMQWHITIIFSKYIALTYIDILFWRLWRCVFVCVGGRGYLQIPVED